MTEKNKFKNRLKVSLLLLMFLATSVYINIFTDPSRSPSNLEDINEDKKDNEKADNIDPVESPDLSIEGSDPWWNEDFLYRQLINITNPYTVSIDNYGVNITFNYQDYVIQDKMEADLKDVRIVENGVLRKYYFEKDYPSDYIATIWFDTNVSAAASPTEPNLETDTYMYYGNRTNVEYAHSYLMDGDTEAFGWVKNGNFELDDGNYGGNNYNVYGWNWTYITMFETWEGDDGGGVNQLIHKDDIANQERVPEGEYAYKWGDIRSSVGSLGDPSTREYTGTLYSYPFTVPTVKGGVSPSIHITIYRNIRTNQFEGIGDYKDTYALRFSSGQYYTGHNPQDHNPLDMVDNFEGTTQLHWNDNYELFDNKIASVIDTWGSPPEYNGDLTGYIDFELTDFMGQTIYLEVGMGGNEEWDAAFGQIDDIRFTYNLTVALNEEEKQKSEVTIIAKDVDGRLVPGAEITIFNSSTIADSVNNYTNSINTTMDGTGYGSAIFSPVRYAIYNITVNYTLENSGLEEVVFNSSKDWDTEYVIENLFETIELELNITTIDFEIVDWDGIPIDRGYINVTDSKGGNVIEILQLDDDGKATFRWLNVSQYYYQFYYDNGAYRDNPLPLNASYIYSGAYHPIGGEKFQNYQILVNVSNIWAQTPQYPNWNHYLINETYYTNESITERGNKKLINFTITMDKMVDLEEVKIYYVSDNDDETPEENLIYHNNTYIEGTNSTEVKIDLMTIENDKLKNENHEAYGLRVYVFGNNVSAWCNGTIDLHFVESRNIFNRTALARLHLKVINKDEDPAGKPLGGVLVRVYNGSVKPANLLVNLTTWSGYGETDPLRGWASSEYPDRILPFCYKIGQAYNFTLKYIFPQKLNVTLTKPEDLFAPIDNEGVDQYAYTLNGNSSVELCLVFTGPDTNITLFKSELFNRTDDGPATWGELITISVNFSHTTNDVDWNPIDPPSIVTCTFQTVSYQDLFTEEMEWHWGPFYSVTINSSRLSAGGSFKYYKYSIFAFKEGYGDPATDDGGLIRVNAIPTSISAYNYETRASIPSAEYSEYYDEDINITILYSYSSGTPLANARLTYQWLGLSPVEVEIDPIYDGFFTFTLDTEDAGSVGIQRIYIYAEYENYTQEDLIVDLDIKTRETSINGETKLLSITEDIYIWDEFTYTFDYRDVTYGSSDRLTYLQESYFYWWELDEDGDIEGSISNNIDLTEKGDGRHVLDFEAEEKDVGEYRLYVTLNKYNYETQNALITLEIEKRTIDVDFEATNLEDDKVTVVKGEDIVMEIELTDPTQDDEPLEDATVILTIGEKEYEFDEKGDGIYTYTFKTDEIDAFFTSQTLTGEITIEKDDYESETVDITLVITMEEIWPGVPTFYFIMVTAAIVGVIGSLVGYRVVQQARIPQFVKKLRKTKRAIKTKKPILESYMTPPKEQWILKEFGDEWEELGVSLKKVIQEKGPKGKFKQGGGT